MNKRIGCIMIAGFVLVAIGAGICAFFAVYDLAGRAAADMAAGVTFCVVFLVCCGLTKGMAR